MGPDGIKEVGEQNIAKAHYLANELCKLPGIRMRYNSPFFNEFVIDTDTDAQKLNDELKECGIIGGLVLEDGGMLWCATEMVSKEDMDFVVDRLKEVLQ